ncbi:MAG: hypothetical protein Q4G40_11910, partial [Brachybacterium sp.]|nr:hypothetical protein [Brachybacterium sp.]
PFVTVCERLGDAVRDLADPLAQEELATFLIGHEREPIEDLNEGLGALLGGWEMRPHADVRPGGRWFRCLDGLRRAADPPDHVTPDPALLAGWAHLTSVQALLAWSECRFGSAARLAESALGASSPDALARWVLAAADAALAPCWHRVRTESRRR